MDKVYAPAEIERRIYERWESHGWFAPRGHGAPYCIMIPPPNVTGTLHMGHAFQHTLMDALTRYHRMRGEDVLWQPGTDHAGIATQMVVERQLNAQGIKRTDLSREAFLERVWQWKGQSGGTISAQMRRLGDSVDWSRDRFTLDPGLSRAVTEVFVRLHAEGLIYRGKRLVNWDPVLLTALSDLEVQSQEEEGRLWHLRYPLQDGAEALVVATTRPETMLGDVAVAVHPEDERYRALIGRRVRLPLAARDIPIIGDSYVDPAFGSGCVKITPAHDFNDYEIGQRHHLPLINIFTPRATLADTVPERFRGLDRFEARRRVLAELEAAALIEKIEKHRLVIPRGDRSGAVLEPYLTDQWYVKIAPLAAPAIAAVESGRTRFVPESWSRTYFEWMRNIKDWCVSRQLWWGHRIPAWYDAAGHIYVGRSESEVRAQHRLPASLALRQDEDVLDTWFSSALWPFSTLGWPERGSALERFYPSSVLVTGFDIIFFWVARMMMMGLKFMDDVPFRDVYITGLIRDEHGDKMSKSKGNVIDPLDIVDGIDLEALIAKRTSGLMQPQLAPRIDKATRQQYPRGIAAHGTDALRFTFAALASPSRDISFDLARVAGYRNFCNKLWNAARFVTMAVAAPPLPGDAPVQRSVADRWIRARFGRMLANVEGALRDYRFDFAASALYEFAWYDFCDWYLELTKPVLQGADAAARRGAQRTLTQVLEALQRALHPFMPFITEEIWQRIAPLAGIEGATVMLAPYPRAGDFPADEGAEREAAWIQAVILGVRQIRGEMNISPGRRIPLLLRDASAQDQEFLGRHHALLERLAGLESVTLLPAAAPAPQSAVALVGTLALLVPMAGLIDAAAEVERLTKLLGKTQTDLAKTRAKLTNENFVRNAPPQVVASERERATELERTAAGLGAQLERVRGMLAMKPPAGSEADAATLGRALESLETVILGKPEQIRLCFACLLARGHLLIEDVPGVGKTTLAHALAHILGLAWQRVQFTSDLLPADIIGVSIFDRASQRFHFRQGPIFTQLLLADEVNRASPRTQSALLEAMEERQVSADGTTYALPDPFFVVATQNPHEQLGTFALPESQLDRFLMRVTLGYPDAAHERALLRGGERRALLAGMAPALTPAAVLRLQGAVRAVHIADALLDYTQSLIARTRARPELKLGLSPRAGQGLIRAAQAWAYLNERSAVLPEDVQAVLPAVVAHRLERRDAAEAGAHEDLARDMIRAVPVPP